MPIEHVILRRPHRDRKLRVRLECEIGRLHSFGHVSLEWARALLGRPEIELRVMPLGHADFDLRSEPKTEMLLPFLERGADGEVDFHIRHHWPPNFEPPPGSGHWILAQPWECGRIPSEWVGAFREKIDDVWCFSRYVQGLYLHEGFDLERTVVVPHGIDPDVFRPDVQPLELPTDRRFRFLFVGGTLKRKGADLLLRAYLGAFSRHDDVTLVVKDMGTKTFYLNQTTGEEFVQASRDLTRPEIVYLDCHLGEQQLAALYTACNVLVMPYRGEGFCLPVLEAMACGLHVIVPGGGATDDFVDGTCGTRIVADRQEQVETFPNGERRIVPLFQNLPDVEELVRAMRWAYEHPEEGKRLGKEASKRARMEWTWDRSAEIIVDRLRVLAGRPIRRLLIARSLDEKLSIEVVPRAGTATGAQPIASHTSNLLRNALNQGDLVSAAPLLKKLLKQESSLMPMRALLERAREALEGKKIKPIRDIAQKRKKQLCREILKVLNGLSNTHIPIRQRVSLTMIVRDEEKNIAECLKSVRDGVDELVVIDTGSRDQTKAIASSLGARVVDFPWVDSFAEARNEGLKQATGDWIFWLDADDRVDSENLQKLKEVFAGLPSKRILGYSMKVECVAQEGQSPTVVDHVRLFPRHPGIRWEYRVHENILPAINRLGGEIVWTDVVIHHYGYLDARHREVKLRRDHALLLKNVKECPEDPFIHFNLGHSYFDSGELDAAARHLRESIARSEPHYSQVKKAYALLAQVEMSRGNVQAALQVLEEGRKHHPGNPELLYLSGMCLHDLGRLEDAKACFAQILETKAWPKEFGSFDVGILSHKTEHRLALVHMDAGRGTEALSILSEVIQAHPDYLPAVKDLARVCIELGINEKAEALCAKLAGNGCTSEARYLEGLLRVRQGKLEDAAERFKGALEIDSKNEAAVAELGHVCLKLGKLDLAESYVREHTQLNPSSAQAHYNLAGICLQRGKVGEAHQAIEKAVALRPDHGLSLALRDDIVKRLEEAGSGDAKKTKQE